MNNSVKTLRIAKTPRKTLAQRGASLVEVLVVLVILLIGVSAIVRVFPLGFQGLRQGENRTLANRLASQMMEQLKLDPDTLMQGVLFRYRDEADGAPTGEDLNQITIKGEDPDDLLGYDHDNDPSTPRLTSPYWSDVNKYRFIEGERVKIPMPTPSQAGRGAIHFLKFGPIYIHPTAGNSQAVVDAGQIPWFNSYLRVRGTPMRGISVDAESFTGSNGDPARPPVSPADQAAGRLRGELSYLIDYGDSGGNGPRVLFPKRTPNAQRAVDYRVFTITFTYHKSTGSGEDVEPVTLTKEVLVADSDEHAWLPLLDENGQAIEYVLDGSDTVSRTFTRLPENSSFDNADPYQYKLLTDNVDSASGKTFANIGMLAFNPSGANYTERTPYGEQPFAALVDYMVLDWHILREDKDVPFVSDEGGRVPLKLTLNFIKKLDDVEADQTLYQGLFRDASVRQDVMVFNMETGQELTGQRYDFGDGAANPNADFWTNTDERGGSYRTGTIYLNKDRIAPGTPIRVLYRADGDWAVAVQKAYSRYEREAVDRDSPVSQVRDTYLPTSYDTFGLYGFARPTLLFHLSELGKSVIVTPEYQTGADSNRRWTRGNPILVSIDEIREIGGVRFAAALLHERGETDQSKNKFMPDRAPDTDWRVFGNVTGASLKVRVIWRDNASTTNTWRVQDLDTYLDRPRGMLDILRR